MDLDDEPGPDVHRDLFERRPSEAVPKEPEEPRVRERMAAKRCTRCSNTIIYGATERNGKLVCLSCDSQLRDEAKGAALRQKQEAELAEKQHNFALARDAYRAALEALKESPSDPQLRARALELGRLYASWTRYLAGQGGITLFDEIALNNDIQAACAAAGASRQSLSLEDRLKRLTSLKEQGLIDDDEYRERRMEILREI